MIKKSIAMPSYRSYALSHGAIYAAENFKLLIECDLFISDNSGDASKSGPYTTKTLPCSRTENFLNAFNGTTGNFVLLMNDDDRILSIADVDIDIPSDVVGIQPTVEMFSPSAGILKISSMYNVEAIAQDRLIEWTKSSGGTCHAFFSFWRRDILGSLLDLWANHHPTKGGYLDWAITNGLISSGKVIRDPSVIYFKDISNWVGDDTAVKKERSRIYAECGYEGLAEHEQIMIAIDSFIFVNRKDSPVAPDERLKAALTCLFPYTFPQVEEVLNKFDLMDKYREFYLYAIGKPWGEF